MCPSLNNKSCIDSIGGVYGIICDVRWSGIVITASGKQKRVDKASVAQEEREALAAAAALVERAEMNVGERDAEAVAELAARTYTGTFDGCTSYCDMFDKNTCVGVSYNNGFAGNCWSMDQISGSFSAPGQIAAIRQF